jgi:hypothetical protein
MIYQHFPFRGPPKFTQLRIFGLKIKSSGNPAHNSSLNSVQSVAAAVEKRAFGNAALFCDGGTTAKTTYTQNFVVFKRPPPASSRRFSLLPSSGDGLQKLLPVSDGIIRFQDQKIPNTIFPILYNIYL